MEELLSLKWNNHKSTFLHILTILRDKQMFTDATLACEGKFYNVHRLVLSTCSDYFSAMFDRIESKNPIIVLKDVNCMDLEALLDYMYLGEVNVKQSELSSLIKTAECLQVKGLAVPDDELPKKETIRKPDRLHSPTAKRKRREEDPSTSISKSSHNNLLDNRTTNSLPDNHISNTTGSEKVPFVKVEVVDNTGDENQDILDDSTSNDCYNNQSTDQFKEESERDHNIDDISNNLPEFVQPSSSSYSHSFDSPSTQADLQTWQGDQTLSANYSVLDFGSNQATDSSSSQNPPGASLEKTSTLSSFLNCSPNPFYGNRFQTLSLLMSKRTCDFCRKFFPGRNWKQDLARHTLVHTGAKPYECPYCPHKTNYSASLKKHILVKHP